MNLLNTARLAACACVFSMGVSVPLSAASAKISSDPASAPVAFAADEIEAALHARHFKVSRDDFSEQSSEIVVAAQVSVYFETGRHGWGFIEPYLVAKLGVDPKAIRAEGFALRYLGRGKRREFWIVSRDAAGAMYGGLELAEQIRTRGIERVVDTDRNPYMPLRGTKFNLPLDLRTPSYSDMSDSAQENIATVWDFDFWREYLDQLARDRYNMVTLWNLHPFPSMVKVPGYPDVALEDVWRSRVKFDEDYSTRATGLVTPAMLANKEVLKTLTIEQKIDFWRRVMAYAHDRNIAIHLVTWNVYTYGVDGKYGITDAIDNPKTRDYFRASVREMFRTYPLLAGIGLTVGENMGEASFQAKEDWALATYGQGVLDAARAEPSRQFRLIHRQHEAGAADIAATFAPVIAQPNVEFVFSFKYAQAHVLSSTTQTFHQGYLESLGPLKTLWTLRNDDALMFRWAAPDFVREFLRNIPYEKSQGYYYGSDMWVWGREFLELAPASPRQLEIDKHWLHFLLWGRLGYDPSLDNERIAALVAQRFPGVDGPKLLAAWQDASMIYPLVTGFHWGALDFQWYIEGSRGRLAPAKTASGFHSVETFINQPVHPGTDNITIPDFIAGVTQGTTPPQVAVKIDARAAAALATVDTFVALPIARKNAEFAATLADIRAMALLGRYYAAKIRGATALAMYRSTRLPEHQDDAVRQLTQAAAFWHDYTQRTGARYRNPLWTNRVGIVDWHELEAEVANDIAIARAPLQ
jgi:hypothetical protein